MYTHIYIYIYIYIFTLGCKAGGRVFCGAPKLNSVHPTNKTKD